MVVARLTIQTEIARLLNTVVGVENVYEDIKVPKDLGEVIADFETSGEDAIQMWQIRRMSSMSRTAETNRGQIETNAVHFYHRFAVTMFYAFQRDKSELNFQALIDAVLDEFVDKRSIGAFSSPHPLHLVQIITIESSSVVGHNAMFEVEVVDPQRNLVAV